MQHWPPLAPLFDSEMFKRFCAPPDQLKGPSVMSADTARLDALSAAISHCSAGGHLARGEGPDVIATAKRFLHFLEGNADPRVDGGVADQHDPRYPSIQRGSLKPVYDGLGVVGVPEAPYSELSGEVTKALDDGLDRVTGNSGSWDKRMAARAAKEAEMTAGHPELLMRTTGLSFAEALVAASEGKIVKRRGIPLDWPFTIRMVNPYATSANNQVFLDPPDREANDYYIVE